ncbi:unnamed protein product [Kuraishia capsulata CBS 1993]|uniref:Uncharacterized protein n=1 Tax=Kuraishia capsulata CBS 1993 TaxID=1382522 RepID=W6MPK6_9ASCO|nr:uncharacterized protein KUCA_T00004628001 [Kuraishia capsulata CBS 1993]CDK28644.1 unnamed protein product [Kuraishia capsulata CBS 1993]
MFELLKGKTVAITGASTGIGRAIARGMYQQGANVVINYFPENKEQIKEILEKDYDNDTERVEFVLGDVSDPATSTDLVAKTVAKHGRLDVFVSNAGICKFYDFLEIPADEYRRHIDINLNGCYFATQAAARQMAKQEPSGGSIIGISSISALVGGGYQTHYTPTKAGILSMMQSEAVALGKYGIRANALLPGTIRTQLNDEDLADEVKRDAMNKRIPLGRFGLPTDLAGPAIFLACEELSGYVTGAQILVDGGLFVNLQ